MTQEERRDSYLQKVLIGRNKNSACDDVCDAIMEGIKKKEISISDALCLVFAEGCEYGKKNHKQLELLDKGEV